MKLEVVPIAVRDVDAAKDFYAKQVGRSKELRACKPGQASLRLLAVDPQAGGHGVGRRLGEACVQVAYRAGKEVATLHSTGQMVAALRTYRSLGFRRDPSGDVELHPGLVLQAFRPPLR